MRPAIILSTHTAGLGVIRGLGMMGVPIVAVHYDSEETGYLSRYVKEKIFAPHPEEFQDQFIDLLVNIATRYEGSLLIPTDDATIVTVSRNKSLLERYYNVACTEWNIAKNFIDKKHTYALAEKIGVPAPRTIVPHSIEDVERYSQTALFPCLVKPTQVHRYYALFQQKMVQVDSCEQMLSAYKQAEDVGIEVMLQELIPGDDSQGANYNSYFWNNEPLVEFTAQQIRNGPPDFGSPRIVLSKYISEVLEPGRKIIKALGFYGFSCTEFKRDPRDGIYKLMEVNGRHNRSSLLAVRCGINFPWLHYQHLEDGKLPFATDFQENVYWISMATDFGYSLKYRRREGYSLSQYIKPYLEPHVFAIFDLRDPTPFVKRSMNLIKRGIKS